MPSGMATLNFRCAPLFCDPGQGTFRVVTRGSLVPAAGRELDPCLAERAELGVLWMAQVLYRLDRRGAPDRLRLK